MGILKTVRLLTLVSLSVASGCIVVARQADATAGISYWLTPIGAPMSAHSNLGEDITGDGVAGTEAPEAQDRYAHHGFKRGEMGTPVWLTYVAAGMSVERLRAPNAVWQIYDQRPKQWVMCWVPDLHGTGGYVTCGGSCKSKVDAVCCKGSRWNFYCQKPSR
jgi:hypothetical protein